VKGLVSKFDVRRTLSLARLLQPQAKQVVIVYGSAPFDKRWEAYQTEMQSALRGDVILARKPQAAPDLGQHVLRIVGLEEPPHLLLEGDLLVGEVEVHAWSSLAGGRAEKRRRASEIPPRGERQGRR